MENIIQSPSEIWNIIPDSLRRIIHNQPGENITGANYLTLTPELEVRVRTPSGEAVVEGMDLNQIAQDFESKVQSKLAPDLIEIEDVLLRNSAQPVVTDDFSFESLQNSPFTRQVRVQDLVEANVFTDANQLQSLLDRMSGASLGAQDKLFVDADHGDDLIEITSEDAAQFGGLRAWGGNDQILGTDSNDIVNGNAGNDKIVGASGHDLLWGGEGNDLIAGGEGDDLVKGDDGEDYLVGGAGNDVIRGGADRDVLMGKAGDDMLICEGDGDLLMGSTGADHFILCGDTFTNRADLADRILDFNRDEGDMLKMVSFPGMDAISFAAVDVNKDRIIDTAMLSSRGVVGVIMSTDPSTMQLSSIFMVGSQDTALSQMW